MWKVSATIRICGLCLLFGFATAKADHYPRQKSLDVLHYTFQVTVTDDSSEIVGETLIELRPTGEGVTEVVLDLASKAADGKGMSVDRVSSRDGGEVKFKHGKDRLTLIPAAALKKDEVVAFRVAYRGVPRSGFLIGKNRHGDRTYFSENWPDKARQWLPTIDHPYDKATSEFLVKAPVQYQVVANGLLQEETDLGDGTRRTHWKQSVPIATWLNALAVAPFASHHAGNVQGIPLQTWVFRQDRDKLFPALEEPARRAVELFNEKVGPYPYEKIAGIQAVGFDGGMELASAIFYGQFSLSGRGVPALVAHEMAHQWFGDSVTESDWDEVWLSEGFATFFAHVYAEKYEGRKAYIDGLKRSRPIIFAAERRDPKVAVIHDNLADMNRVLNGLVYQKGAWVLHMLRCQIGDEHFWTGIRTYYARYRDKNATTANLRQVFEETAKTDLGWFFDQWLKRPGSPKIEGTWSYDPASKKLTVALAQIQAGGVYRLPLEIGVNVSVGSETTTTIKKVEMTEQKQQFELAILGEPTAVVLDPETKILMDAKFGKK